MERLSRQLELEHYSCGSRLQDIDLDTQDEELISKGYVQANLLCGDKVEVPYYSCGVYEPICVYCGLAKDLMIGEVAKAIYPTCSHCFFN